MNRWTYSLISGLTLSICASAGTAEPIPLNLALDKPATASSSQSGNRERQAVDGDPGTRWCASDATPTQWWQVDLQQPEDLTACRVTWEFDGVRYQYKIEGSADGRSWATLVDQTGEDASTRQTQEHKLDAKGIRFVRVSTTKSEAGHWVSFYEFEVYGSGKTADAASVARRKNANLLREIQLPSSLQATLFAAPPEVSYPVCLVAAPEGDVFVAIDPNGSLDQKKGRGRILRCRDTNRDGVADEFKTFASVDSPRGMVWDSVNRIMYVQRPPFVQAFHDDDADGVSDRAETLVEGLGYTLDFRGADHTTNGMQVGIDGWLYIAVGDYGFLSAKGRDGKTLQLHGGGVVRVRTDGTRLEIVSRGQRNIYDVSISPRMDLFTRDNTNDGDGWDERLSHVVYSANFGYPSLFKNFPGDYLKPLADYGGGSPTGSLFLDEPGFHEGVGRALYTCDWGTNRIDRHPLEPSGATFKAGQERFIEMPRPIDIDVDASSRLYVASWRNGGFGYSGPNVGYVARIIDPSTTPAPLLELQNATAKQLDAELMQDSHVRRLRAQREIVRRGGTPDAINELMSIAIGGKTIETRVAALFTLAQFKGDAAAHALQGCIGVEELREFALPASIDQSSDPSSVGPEPFIAALKHANPRIRLQGVIGLSRIGNRDVAFHVVPSAGDRDPVVAHAAVQTLVTLKAARECFESIDHATEAYPGALRAVQQMHDPAVVDGLIARIGRTSDWMVRQAMLTALCRLYYREADWTSGWWGTRPDTSGPYFQPVTWERSESILKALRTTLASADAKTLRFLLVELQRHKIELPDATAKLLALAKSDPSVRETAIDLLATRPALPRDAIALFAETALMPTEKPDRRARALSALCRGGNDTSLTAISVLRQIGDAGDAPDELKRVRAEYLRDAQRAQDVSAFGTLAGDSDPQTRGLAYAVLLQLAANKQAPADARNTATHAIAAAWEKPALTASLLRAIGDERVDGYAEKIHAHLADADGAVKTAASYASSRLGNGNANKLTIGKLPYDQLVASVLKTPGDAKIGAELFARQTCVTCHTVTKNETPKGPFLGGIAKRYSRAELVESIVKPNAKIAQGFVTHYFVTKKRERIDGFVVREAGDEVEVRTVQGTSVKLKNADVTREGTLATSIMPEQLVDNLSSDELASLIAFLESLKTD